MEVEFAHIGTSEAECFLFARLTAKKGIISTRGVPVACNMTKKGIFIPNLVGTARCMPKRELPKLVVNLPTRAPKKELTVPSDMRWPAFDPTKVLLGP